MDIGKLCSDTSDEEITQHMSAFTLKGSGSFPSLTINTNLSSSPSSTSSSPSSSFLLQRTDSTGSMMLQKSDSNNNIYFKSVKKRESDAIMEEADMDTETSCGCLLCSRGSPLILQVESPSWYVLPCAFAQYNIPLGYLFQE